MIVHTILYVKDQKRSTDFYRAVLQLEPKLDVPGMTEFQLSDAHTLGLMPEAGIKRLLSDKLPDPSQGSGIPRAELYIRVQDPEVLFERALAAGAKLLSSLEVRPWGDRAGYVLDPDSHVLALAT
jgi:uncharacterized glyoxalase superfamily protein PhnB